MDVRELLFELGDDLLLEHDLLGVAVRMPVGDRHLLAVVREARVAVRRTLAGRALRCSRRAAGAFLRLSARAVFAAAAARGHRKQHRRSQQGRHDSSLHFLTFFPLNVICKLRRAICRIFSTSLFVYFCYSFITL